MNYSYRVDKIFGTPMYSHRTLRTIFDPDATEWGNTEMDKKVEILEKILASGYPLENWIEDYVKYYTSLKKSYVKTSIPKAMTWLRDRCSNLNAIEQIDNWLKSNEEKNALSKEQLEAKLQAYYKRNQSRKP